MTNFHGLKLNYRRGNISSSLLYLEDIEKKKFATDIAKFVEISQAKEERDCVFKARTNG